MLSKYCPSIILDTSTFINNKSYSIVPSIILSRNADIHNNLLRPRFSKIRFHDLRHSHASMLLNNGVNPKIGAERLGHSSVQIYLDRYSHLLPNMQRDAVDLVE
ncbi:tyrosine-type recombinase/integrase [Paenibacillus sp. F411]|nr:tyrosine-type recombinase/integrase [Paenibacillus sp. F411]